MVHAVAREEDFSPYSSIRPFLGELPSWYPEDARERVAAYVKYDEVYWNDDSQFELRVLEGEEPIYIPNARTIVDTTSHFLLKGLTISVHEPESRPEQKKALDDFLKREEFLSKFAIAKLSGVARGDFVLHLTADPMKPEGERVSINSLHPGVVIPVYDEENFERLLRVHLVDTIEDPNDSTKQLIHKLTYEYDFSGATRRVFREEAMFALDPKWYGPVPKKVKTLIERAPLDERITTIPVYWFKNQAWESDPFGSSELKGFVKLIQGVSQAATDEQTALALEGIGVYATDSGRPVNDEGKEIDWVIHPARVMEVVSGSYFRRVEGVSTLKPFQDHINYFESKLFQGSGLTDVALGQIDVQTAQSGIALAIKFMPTMAKLEQRDLAGIAKLQQLFHDWKTWMFVYENTHFDDDAEIEITLGDKLPTNNVEIVNQLNNMFDRKIISKQYYRERMAQLGHSFPDNIEDEIRREQEEAARIMALSAPQPLQANAEAAANGQKPPPPSSAGGRQNAPRNTGPNRSNNRNRTNESDGTEAK